MRMLWLLALLLAACSPTAPEVSVTFTETDRRPLTADEKKVVRDVAGKAISDASHLLPGLSGTIELEVISGSGVIPGFGSGGMAASPEKIQWTVDPQIGDGPVETISKELRTTLFHETHHLARGWTVSGGTAGTRIIDAAVAEGMATAFERDAGGGDPPWGEYPLHDVENWVEELVNVTDGFQSYSKWMFNHPDGRQWIGYRAGTYLTDRAMENCNCTSADLVLLPTAEILALKDD